MPAEYVGRFIGPESITAVDLKFVSKDGYDVFDVTSVTADGHSTTRRFTRPGLDVCVSDEAKDWNYVQDARFTPIISKITGLMIEYGIRGGEIDPLLKQVGRNCSNALDKAVHVKWYGSADGFVADGNPFFDFTITEADNTI